MQSGADKQLVRTGRMQDHMASEVSQVFARVCLAPAAPGSAAIVGLENPTGARPLKERGSFFFCLWPPALLLGEHFLSLVPDGLA
jgi:hypothetical protein